MGIDLLPKKTTKVFIQRDVRRTPAATATATAVSLTDPTYVTLSNNADLINERILAAGEGINVTDGGANNNVTISGEDATSTNKGIASFPTADYSTTGGAPSIKDDFVRTVDGDTGTATGSAHNIDILGGTGISTVGASNDITITSTHASDNGSSHADVATNTTHGGLTNDPHSVTASQVGLGNVSNVSTDDTAYNATSWNTNTDSATKNAIRDKVETMDTAISSNTSASHAESHNMASHTDDYSPGVGIDISAGNVISGEDSAVGNKGIIIVAGTAGEIEVSYASGTATLSLTNKTSYLSIPAEQWHAARPSLNNVVNNGFNQLRTDDDGVTFFCPVNLPHGAVITSIIVHGSENDESWVLYRRLYANGAAQEEIAGAAFGTLDATISNGTIDNNDYTYFMRSTTLDTNDEIYGCKIAYTTDYD